jgi:GT2 family glycosyltransferase
MKRDAFFKIGGYDPNFQKMSPDIELGKRLKKQGSIIFNPSIKVYSSFRRFQHGGVISTALFFLKSWYQMATGKQPTVSYEQYNQEIR